MTPAHERARRLGGISPTRHLQIHRHHLRTEVIDELPRLVSGTASPRDMSGARSSRLASPPDELVVIGEYKPDGLRAHRGRVGQTKDQPNTPGTLLVRPPGI